MGTFKNLIVWQKSMDLARAVYSITRDFPKNELFGLVSQMKRSSVSIPSNIAEGFGCDSDNEHIHFLFISLGSSNELETQLILAHDFNFVGDKEYNDISHLNNEVNIWQELMN